MKIIYSYWNYEKNKKSNYIDSNIIFISLKSVKKLGYKTLLYCDENNYDNLKDFEFDEIKIFDQKELDKLPSNVWCLGKLLAMRETKETFCHIDFDIIMLKDVLNKFKNEKFFSLHKEGWRNMSDYRFKDEILNRFEEFNNIYNINLQTYNCAVVGGSGVNEINNSANLVLNFCKENKNLLEDIQRSSLSRKNHWGLPVFLEQVIFMNFCKHELKIHDIKSVCDLEFLNLCTETKIWDLAYEAMVKKGIIHLWGYKEYFSKNLSKFLVNNL